MVLRQGSSLSAFLTALMARLLGGFETILGELMVAVADSGSLSMNSSEVANLLSLLLNRASKSDSNVSSYCRTWRARLILPILMFYLMKTLASFSMRESNWRLMTKYWRLVDTSLMCISSSTP